MTPHLTWTDIALRLLLTMVAGAVIGFNRGAKGQTVGLRTTILFGLAASVAMIQANILLTVAGKTSDSFGVMDLMRLPLGILTGVGFIGGGAILKRGDLVRGVTTASTLWVVTIIGLCLGCGQLGPGMAATVLSVLTLWALKWLDVRMSREQRARIIIESDLIDEFPSVIAPLGYAARLEGQTRDVTGPRMRLGYDVIWRRPEVAEPPLDVFEIANDRFRVVSLELIRRRPSTNERHQEARKGVRYELNPSRKAVRAMRGGPSGSAFRSGSQTSPGCCGKEPWW
jgi:putative Mg2+ transporter-C (MgtC) family protein